MLLLPACMLLASPLNKSAGRQAGSLVIHMGLVGFLVQFWDVLYKVLYQMLLPVELRYTQKSSK